MPLFETLAAIAAIVNAGSQAANTGMRLWGDEEEEPPSRTGYMPPPSRFTPQNREPGPMAPYMPQNRQRRSGTDPAIMQYLQKFMQPRY